MGRPARRSLTPGKRPRTAQRAQRSGPAGASARRPRPRDGPGPGAHGKRHRTGRHASGRGSPPVGGDPLTPKAQPGRHAADAPRPERTVTSRAREPAGTSSERWRDRAGRGLAQERWGTRPRNADATMHGHPEGLRLAGWSRIRDSYRPPRGDINRWVAHTSSMATTTPERGRNRARWRAALLAGRQRSRP